MNRPEVIQQAATYWTAEMMQARADVKAAFQSHEKLQWQIGDLLNVIAPSKGRGVDNPEATARLKQVAEENGVSFNTVDTYRRVAAAYQIPARGDFRSFRAATDALTAKSEKDETGKASPEQLLTKLFTLLEGLKGKELDEHDRISLRTLRLAVDTLLDEGDKR